MKKSYKKILTYQIIVFLIFILNSFISNILGGYNFIIFLLLALIFFKTLFGFEKDRHRYTKDIIYETLIFLLTFYVLFYLFGVIIGFAKTNYLNWYGMKTFIFPLILSIILKEILRYMMLKKCEENKFLSIITVILFIFMDVTEAIYYGNFNSSYNVFIFIALSLLPAISSNVMCNYITKKTGYKPLILYLLITKLYAYLLPIIPNPSEYLTAIINLILPVLLGYKIHNFLEKDKDTYIDRDYNKKRVKSLVLPIILTLIIVYFTSGYFKYYALAIASGSMSPKIKKGDIVIVEKIKDKYQEIKEKDIIAYEYNGTIIVHRVEKIINLNGIYYFYTKGDANNSLDNYSIDQSMIIGVVRMDIPYIGWPTVWLNE